MSLDLNNYSFLFENENLDIHSESTDVPTSISSLLTPSNSCVENILLSGRKLTFCLHAAKQCLMNLKKQHYTQFDALTTTTCCHGIALLVQELIFLSTKLDFDRLLLEVDTYIQDLSDVKDEKKIIPCSWTVPKFLIDLIRLYLLTCAREKDDWRHSRTHSNRLKKIYPIGTTLCTEIVKNFQYYFSNRISERYAFLYERMRKPMMVNGISVDIWGKYIKDPYIRVDRRGRKYAPSLFSIQICLAHLIQNRLKFALVHDFWCDKEQHKGKHISIFEGDGESGFIPISLDQEVSYKNSKEPVIVFGSCSYSQEMDKKLFKKRMEQWQLNISKLILANEVFYPHYPAVSEDINFNSEPIIPDEPILQTMFADLSKMRGMSAKNPSFCCITHIYPASLYELSQVYTEQLPKSFVSGLSTQDKNNHK